MLEIKANMFEGRKSLFLFAIAHFLQHFHFTLTHTQSSLKGKILVESMDEKKKRIGNDVKSIKTKMNFFMMFFLG